MSTVKSIFDGYYAKQNETLQNSSAIGVKFAKTIPTMPDPCGCGSIDLCEIPELI